MINADMNTFEAVVCCDHCLVEIARGPYPADAEDNVPPECFFVVDEDKGQSEHYCNTCYHLAYPEDPEKDAFIEKHLSRIKNLTAYYKSLRGITPTTL